MALSMYFYYLGNQYPNEAWSNVNMLKLLVTILLFLCALLTILPAPAYYFWLLAILVSEFCWAFILLALIWLIVLFISSSAYPIATNSLALIALILFCSPLIRAYRISLALPDELGVAFGSSRSIPARRIGQPFAVGQLFSGIKPVPFQSAVYKKPGLSLDFYAAKTSTKQPCVIVIHGGSWKSGDSQQLPELNSYLAEQGYHVAAINYRLAPTFQSPAPVEDVRGAIAFLKQKSEEWAIDTTRFVLVGRSAGGQIALLAAYTLNEPGIKGVVDFYGPADMVWGYSRPANPLVFDSQKVMEDYLGGTYQSHPQAYANSSPIQFVSVQSPPTLLIHGPNDVLVFYEHSQRLAAKLREKHVKHYLLTLPWATHGFDYNLNGPGGQLSTYAITHFLGRVL